MKTREKITGKSATMSVARHNEVRMIFNGEYKPYVYAAICIVEGEKPNLRTSKPFIISKLKADGEEIVYGTIKQTMQRISSQLEKIKKLETHFRDKFNVRGNLDADGQHISLPENDITDQILDEQEVILEEVLINVSVHIRILAEIFPNQFRRYKVSLYDYDDKVIEKMGLREVANLLLHYRYFVIRGKFVVDLFSDQRFMNEQSQIGLKFSFIEYFEKISAAVSGITVGDLVGELKRKTDSLSASSSPRDIIFLFQNLYTLGGYSVNVAHKSPLKEILRQVVLNHQKEKTAQKPKLKNKEFRMRVAFREPRFYWEPDLNRKQIRIVMEVNGQMRNRVLDSGKFYKQILVTAGNIKLTSLDA